MDSKLIEILENRPSVIRNTVVITMVRMLSWILGFSLIVVGISILIHNFVYEKLLARFDFLEDIDTAIMTVIGISLIIVGALLFFVIRLCKMLIRRNLFLLELDEWRYEWEEREE
jgi:hypothetical protein